MMGNHSKVLLVEGEQDKRVIPQLMESNGVVWGSKNNEVVFIKDYGGYQNLVKPDVLKTNLQASGLSALGVVVDADENASDRWSSLRSAAASFIPDLPSDIPETGLIHSTPNGIRFGAWIMPDNTNVGMLETFLSYLIRDERIHIWELAKSSAANAKKSGAPFSGSHAIKAEIYTWLAWQNTPGRQLHQAVKERIFDPTHNSGASFVKWFKTLYQV
jgi:hypothetical protein